MQNVVGNDGLRRTATILSQSALHKGTYENYGSNLRIAFNSFVSYSSDKPLKTTTVHIARYIAWLEKTGTIGAESMQP
jgi:hypothetical protein